MVSVLTNKRRHATAIGYRNQNAWYLSKLYLTWAKSAVSAALSHHGAKRLNSRNFACFSIYSLSGLSQTPQGTLSRRNVNMYSKYLTIIPSSAMQPLISWQSHAITIMVCSILNSAKYRTRSRRIIALVMKNKNQKAVWFNSRYEWNTFDTTSKHSIAWPYIIRLQVISGDNNTN